ncbi:ribose transport system permease protein [Peptoclostridium litorale DSM 5388]|uniref:Ribose transport system permease protein RbsC n=1 Tax=Peptoclostridium litorale DSM 5388 TaxID=1121324 RepID=A0A069RLT0_PEPLI|nr:ribose ABC transporter permease [Peptoclostridium litorale]KDR95127.1 ribose transport system permease protein RbsC [Peptoclostridium litorale DSM 5388]SIN74580.1 ribose transport system permease protein [Peptoclostridium litorale DSM 5388]
MNKQTLMKFKSIIGLLIFTIIISFLNPRFLTWPNMLNVFRQTSINSVIAAGMTFVILTGGIDLSVGSILAFTGAICASLLSADVNIIAVVAITLFVGAVSGMCSGVVISKGKVQPFIATLATMTILRGATLVFTKGKPITFTGAKGYEAFSSIGAGYFMKIPVPIYIMIIVFALGFYLLTQTRLGRYVYALGGNEEASRLSGLNTDKIKIYVYAISGLMAALAGIIITARLSSAQPTAGTGYELDAIAAVVLGGTSLTGGAGSIMGTVIGALIIGILGNALNLMDVSSYYQMMIKGMVILVAVLIDKKSK